MKMRRLFAGVRVEATEELRTLLEGLRTGLAGERIRWVRPENLHLTVEFFGSTPEERIPDLEQALAVAAGQAPAFEIQLGRLGIFGSARHPRVIWLAVASAGLQTLHRRTADALRVAGWPPEERTFTPHLTLGRAERIQDARRFRELMARQRDVSAGIQSVDELILFESVAGVGGTSYRVVRQWALA